MPAIIKIIIILVVMLSNLAVAQREGEICHANPEESKFNYAGLWERDEVGVMICNYRQFLSEEEWLNSRRATEPEDDEQNQIEKEFNIIIDESYDLISKLKGKGLRDEGECFQG
ncbi:hypothetical protein [Avibacterium sp. 21-599]|uniref:hypothetical protein n=1 Tax=Avibacterium sp. 21-599 TaxID=2911528 RepID=UPI0022459601|nr:hypothetical protein [Avibacterium sp. 21-599]MCW9718525.1 hypothetical protein [Avibacterium sp. 21-599]